MSPVAIGPAAVEAMTRHAAQSYPYECCGAMIEVAGEIVDAFPLSNVTPVDAEHRFVVSPTGYLASERRAAELGGSLAGFYHSHPDHPARPSQTDLEAAWPNLTYVIISVSRGTPGDVTAWQLRADRSGFDRQDWLSGRGTGVPDATYSSPNI